MVFENGFACRVLKVRVATARGKSSHVHQWCRSGIAPVCFWHLQKLSVLSLLLSVGYGLLLFVA